MPKADPSATPPGQPGDVPMAAGDEVGEASATGQGGSPPDASMPGGSGGGGGGGCAATCGRYSPCGEKPWTEAEEAVLPWA